MKFAVHALTLTSHVIELEIKHMTDCATLISIIYSGVTCIDSYITAYCFNVCTLYVLKDNGAKLCTALLLTCTGGMALRRNVIGYSMNCN